MAKKKSIDTGADDSLFQTDKDIMNAMNCAHEAFYNYLEDQNLDVNTGFNLRVVFRSISGMPLREFSICEPDQEYDEDF